MKEKVRKGYEEGEYLEEYRRDKEMEPFQERLVEKLVDQLSEGAEVLDLGCGNGVPFDRYLSNHGLKVTGVEMVEDHVEEAQKNVPDAEFLHADFDEVDFEEKFDAAVSFYAIFHIPREKHESLLKQINNWLKEDGLVLLTLGAEEMQREESEFSGSKMVWSSYSIERNIEVVEEAGFEILEVYEEDRENEHHLWILAQTERS